MLRYDDASHRASSAALGQKMGMRMLYISKKVIVDLVYGTSTSAGCVASWVSS
jgi:hypothetical protein